MATKPTDLPPVWAGAGVYAAGFYSPELPWGAVNPLAGQPFPWGGQPRLNAGSLTAFANAGFTPQVPNNPSQYNEWLRRVQIYVLWVDLGTSADDADAHVMETDASGISSAQKYQATAGFCNAGVTSAIMLAGATIPNGEDLEIVGTATIKGEDTTRCLVAAVDFQNGGGFGVPTATSVSVSTSGELFYGTASRIHHTPNGYVYATGDQEAAAGMAATQQVCTTTVAVTALGAGNVRVIVVIETQLAGLPNNVTIKLQEDQTASPNWTDIGTAKVITGTHDTANANSWQTVRHERIFAAGTSTATKYRAELTGGGGNINVKEGRLRAVNERG